MITANGARPTLQPFWIPIVSFDDSRGAAGRESTVAGGGDGRGQKAGRLALALLAAALLTAAGAGIGTAFYRLYPAQTSLLVGLTRTYIRSWSAAPDEATKTEPAHTGPGAIAADTPGDC